MGLQIRPRLDYKLGKLLRLQIGAKRLQTRAGITNRGKKITNQGRDYKSVQNNLMQQLPHAENIYYLTFLDLLLLPFFNLVWRINIGSPTFKIYLVTFIIQKLS